MVTNTADSGSGSLRQALLDANADTTADSIHFNIPGAGPHRINLVTELPDIVNPVTINGYSQPGSTAATASSPAALKIEVGGNDFITSGGHQFLFEIVCQAGEAVEIRGLSLVDADYAVVLRSAGGPHVVAGNWFGIRPNGDLGFNKTHTIHNETPNTQVGGTSDADRNLFAGQEHHSIYNLPSAVGTMIENNWFGVAPDGVSATIYGARNGSSCGIFNSAPNATIRNNVISGSRYGMRSFGGGATIQGNLFGLDPTGMFMISNQVWDVEAGNVGDNIIGGPNPGEGNRFGKYNSGCYVHGVNSSNNLVQANTFGLDATGNAGVNTNYYYVGGWSIYIRAPHNQVLNNTMGNTRYGMLVHSSWAHHNIVRGNAVGVNEARDDFLPSRIYGVQISGGAYENTFGGPDPSHANIFGNIRHHGMLMENTHRNWIEGNYLGQLPDGTPGDLLYDACYSYNNCTSNTFLRNTITNPRYGIVFRGTNAIGNVVSETSITSNAFRAIELHEWNGSSDSLNVKNTNDPLDADKFAANWGQNHPELTWAGLDSSGRLNVQGIFHGAPSTPVTIELFANEPAHRSQLNRYLDKGQITTDAAGNASFSLQIPSGISVGDWIVATATTVDGTSELSEPLEVSEEVDLRLTSVQAPNPADEFESVVLTFTLENLGPGRARDLTLDIPMWGLTPLGESASLGIYHPVERRWEIGDLANGQTATLTINAQVIGGFGGRTLNNEVVLDGLFSDTNPANQQTLVAATIRCPTGIRGATFIDRDGDGQFGPVDGPASGVRVIARDAQGNTVAEGASGPSGLYILNVPNGFSGTVELDVADGHWDAVATASTPVNSPACMVDFPVSPSRRFSPYRHPPGPSTRLSPLTITEIHYHAPDRADGRDLEFIELFNSDPVQFNISGYQLEGDVDYTFPANTVLPPFGYVVIAANPIDLFPQTSPGTYILGPYDGNLDNGGGTVRLVDDFGRYLLEIPFDDRPPWPRMADGHGHSLVLTRPTYGEQHHLAWGFSAKLDGSPGRHDDLVEDDLVMNEILADANGFVELFNRGDQPHNLAGMQITTNAATPGFTIPSGMLSPGQRRAFTTAQLGFDLTAAKVVMLVDPANQRVRDLQTVGPRRSGVAFGRSPDGSERIHDLATPTSGSPNANPQNGPVVISEIMYNPHSNEDDDEYLELYNRSATPVDLSAWSFSDGIDFEFPQGSIIPVGGYIVVAKDASRLIATYSQLNAGNTLGDYKGTLANGGETIVLRDALGRFMDDVQYEDGGRWGEWSDGDGSSLELIDPDADNSDPSNWRDSDETQKSQWQTFTRSGVMEYISHLNTKIQIMNLSGGEFLLDDVQVFGDGQSLLAPDIGGFEMSSNSWTIVGNHRDSDIIDTEFASGSHSLHMRASQGGNTLANFAQHYLSTNTLTNAVNVQLSLKARWLRGSDLMVMRTFGRGFELLCEFDVPTNLGSPGLANSTAVANAGPAIREVRHEPVFPAAGDPVTLFAEIADPDGVSAVSINYRVNPGTNPVPVQAVSMRDDGIAPDLVANDGQYAGTIPAQAVSNIVAFSVLATDAAGASHAFPDTASVREGTIYWGDSPVVEGVFNSIRMWIDLETVDEWVQQPWNGNQRSAATIILNGHRVIYHSTVRYRGSAWGRPGNHGESPHDPLGKDDIIGSYAINPPSDSRIWNSTRIRANLIGGRGNIGEPSSLREKVSYHLAKGMGMPTSHTRFLRFGINGNNDANLDGVMWDVAGPGDTDYLWSNHSGNDEGQLHKAIAQQEVGDDWKNEHGLFNEFEAAHWVAYPSVNDPRYALPRTRWVWPRKNTTGKLDDDYSSLFDLIDAWNAGPNGDDAAFVAAMEHVVDVQQFWRINAFQQYRTDFDSLSVGWAHNVHIYLPAGGKWQMHNRDFDNGWGFEAATRPLFDTGWGTTRPEVDVSHLARAYRTPAFRRIIFDGLRSAVEDYDAPAHPAKLAPFLNEWKAVLDSENMTNTDIGTIIDWVPARRDYILSQIPQASLAIDQVNYNTGDDTAVLTGTAPIGANTLLFNGNAYPVTWTTDTVWRVEIPLVAGANPIQLTAIDYDGNAYPSAGVTSDNVTVNKTTPAPSAVGSVVINEIHYHGTTGDDFVELHNTSTTDRFDLSGWRLDGVDLDIAGGTLIEPGAFLTFVADREDFGALYPLIPIAAEYDGSLDNGGEILELLDASSNIVDVTRYDDAWPWPLSADGSGDSLQLIDASQNSLHPGNWAAAAPTPNAANTPAASLGNLAPVWINELAPNDPTGPWVELYTAGTSSITGFKLQSELGQVLPLGHNLSGWRTLTFSFPNPTGTVALVDNNGLVLDALDFAHVAPNHSVGLVPDGDPLSIVRMHQPTPNAANNPTSVPTPVLFNEWMASNPATTGILDPADNDADDWLELYNPSATPADLSDHRIADSSGSTRLPPGTVIPAGGHLLLWADNEPGQGPDHLDFKLSGGGETITLSSPDGTTVQTLSFGAQASGIPEGRWKDGEPAPFWPLFPTPGAANLLTALNTAPALFHFGATTKAENSTFAINFYSQDQQAPPQTVTIAQTSGPGNFNPASGLFSWTPREADGPGTRTVTFTATDNGSPPAQSSISLTLTITEANSNPVLPALGPFTVDEHDTLTFIGAATDVDLPAQTLSYALQGAVPGMVIDPATGYFSWTPNENQGPATYQISLVVYDGYDFVARNISITVREANSLPLVYHGPLVSCSTERLLVPKGAAWRYHDNGTTPAAQTFDWTHPGFDDSAWAAGPAKFGFGENGIATPLAAGRTTYYFRHTFAAGDIAGLQALLLELLRDDGAAVYLNGVEIRRDNLPAGPLSATTRALNSVFGFNESLYHASVPATASLLPGENVLAVELHQVVASSNDLGFDLRFALTELRPCASALPAQSTAANTPWSLDFDVLDTDLPAQAITWSLQGAPAGVSINANGLVQWNAPSPGAHTFTVVATDAAGGQGTFNVPLLVGSEVAINPRVLQDNGIIQWPTVPGRTYTVERCDNLVSGPWIALQTITASGTLSQITDSTAQPDDHRFYRIKWVQ